MSNVTTIKQVKGLIQQMEKELEQLRREETFREFIGYELALNKIKDRFKIKLEKNN